MYTQGVPARRRGVNLLRFAVAALAMVGVLVLGASRVAFSQPTGEPSSGGVVLTDDDAGSAMFSIEGMMPSATVVNCIEVIHDGDVTPAEVSLYGTSGGTGLDTYLDLTIEDGTGGVFGDCSGFASASTLFSGTLAEFAGSHHDFATGMRTQSPSYRFTLSLRDDDAAQGLEATPAFVWETQAG